MSLSIPRMASQMTPPPRHSTEPSKQISRFSNGLIFPNRDPGWPDLESRWLVNREWRFLIQYCKVRMVSSPIHSQVMFMAGFNWEVYPRGSLVVDVGGGVGSQCVALAKNYPHLSFAIQDRASVVQEAVKVHFPVRSLLYLALIPFASSGVKSFLNTTKLARFYLNVRSFHKMRCVIH